MHGNQADRRKRLRLAKRSQIRKTSIQRIGELRSRPLSSPSMRRLLFDGLAHLAHRDPVYATRWLDAIKDVARFERRGVSLLDGLPPKTPETAVARRLDAFTAFDLRSGMTPTHDWKRVAEDMGLIVDLIDRLCTPPPPLEKWQRAAARWWRFPLLQSRPLPSYVPGRMRDSRTSTLAASEIVAPAYNMTPADLRKKLRSLNTTS